MIENLLVTQADTVEERRGPRVGAPQNAIDGFLKSAGISSLDGCEQRDTGKGVFSPSTRYPARAGRATADILPELLHAILLDLSWPQIDAVFRQAPFRWVRPIRERVASLFDSKIVRLNLGGIPVGDTTLGHRFLGNGTIPVENFTDYRRKLREAHVILDAKDRRQAITLALFERAFEESI